MKDYDTLTPTNSKYYIVTPTSFQELSLAACLTTATGLSSFYELAGRVYLTAQTCTSQRTGPTTFTQIRSGMGSRVPAYIAP